MSDISLEELAGSTSWICLDNNIFSKDRNYSLRCNESKQKINGGDSEFAKQLSEAKKISEVRQIVLERQVGYSSKLLNAIEQMEEICTVHGVLEEYQAFIENIRKSLCKLSKKGNFDKKEDILRKILENHEIICSLLNTEGNESYDSKQISKFLSDKKMHLPKSRLFNKRYLRDDVDSSDAEMVSYAILKAQNVGNRVAIISSDIDLPNLAWNFMEAYQGGKLSPNLRDIKLRSPISVYFPDRNNWTQEFGLELACNSDGYHW